MATIRSFIKFWALSAFAIYGWLRLKLNRSPTLIILTYHRVLPHKHPEREREQPGMIVAPETLQRHIRFIRSLGAIPTHLDDWLSKKKEGGTLPALSVAFTFDDGWKDNYTYAYPILKQEQVPATIFLVTGMIDTSDTFWPEKVLTLLRTPGINLQSTALSWLTPHLGSYGGQQPPLSLLEADEVINRLKDLDDRTIIEHLNHAEEAGIEISTSEGEPTVLSRSELYEMAKTGLVKYGAHTRKHYRLNRLENEEALRDQIIGCLSDLHTLRINDVPIFCYPNGDITLAGEQLVLQHYRAACTTKTGWNNIRRSPYDLHRFNLHDGNSNSSRALLATIGRGLS